MHSQVEVNRAARAVAARVVQKVPPLKVPLSEMIKGGKPDMSTTMTTVTVNRKPRVYGVPLLVAEVLSNSNGLGLTGAAITDLIRPKIKGAWNRQNTSNILTSMRVKGWVTKWPGNVWKLGPKPVKYEAGSGVPKAALNGLAGQLTSSGGETVTMRKRVKAAPAKAAPVKKAKGATDPVQRALDAIEATRESLSAVADAIAALDTELVKARQASQAMEAARKLLGNV